MALKETKNEPKELVEPVPEEVEKLDEKIEKQKEKELAEAGLVENMPEKKITYKERREMREKEAKQKALDSWVPKTELGRLVKHGKIKDYNEILESGKKVIESEIIDTLLPHLESDLILIGQAKGKFGGGKRRAWRQTQKKTMEGNVLTFSCMAVVGNKKGLVGVGYGRSSETLPSREKAMRNAKLNLVKITRGFESQESDNSDSHTVPFIVEGKCGSVRIKLIPAPRGTGLVAGDECKKILRLAGIKDVYTVSSGGKRTSFNFVKACLDALLNTNKMRL